MVGLKKSDIFFLEQSILRDDYFEFFKKFWPEVSEENLVVNWHIPYIAAELQKVANWVVNREPKEYDLLINVPPGTSKSTLVTRLFPVWIWTKDPSIKIISGSYDARLSIGHASASRDVIASESFQEWFGNSFKIRSDFDNKLTYYNTRGGARITTSTGKSIIGEHAHLILIDDPIDPKGTKSAAVMQTVEDWVEITLPTRKVDKRNTPIIMIMQRLHEKDPAGVWLTKAKEDGRAVKHICLPATDDYPVIPEDVRPEYKKRGGLLDPVRMPIDIIDEYKGRMGSTEFAGQFGQQPRAIGGNIVKKWMLPVVPYSDLPPQVLSKVRDFAVDSADKDGHENDYSGFICYTEYKGYCFVFEFRKIRQRFSGRVNFLKNFVKQMGSRQSRVWIEPKSSGPAIQQYLESNTDLNALEWKMAKGDKMTRLQAITPFLEAKRVVLVEGPWNDSFIDIVTGFPNVEYDEEIDCLTMAVINSLLRKLSNGYNIIT